MKKIFQWQKVGKAFISQIRLGIMLRMRINSLKQTTQIAKDAEQLLRQTNIEDALGAAANF